MTIQEWIDNHEGGFAIGNLINSEYVENYMIIKYSDWFISDVLNYPTYKIWNNVVNRDLKRLSAFYEELYSRKKYDFVNSYRKDKDGHVEENVNETTIKSPNLTTTYNMGEWEETVNNTEYKVAIDSFTEKEVAKNTTHTEQPITINTDTTSGTQKDENEYSNIKNYTENESGFNGKTQSGYIIDSYAEMDLNPIDTFIDKFVRGYFICG